MSGEAERPKMIEVPEEHLLALKKWRRDGKYVDPALVPHIKALIACLPKPIEVGSRVRAPKGEGIVMAVDAGYAWVRFGGGVGHLTCSIEYLEVIE